MANFRSFSSLISFIALSRNLPKLLLLPALLPVFAFLTGSLFSTASSSSFSLFGAKSVVAMVLVIVWIVNEIVNWLLVYLLQRYKYAIHRCCYKSNGKNCHFFCRRLSQFLQRLRTVQKYIQNEIHTPPLVLHTHTHTHTEQKNDGTTKISTDERTSLLNMDPS